MAEALLERPSAAPTDRSRPPSGAGGRTVRPAMSGGGAALAAAAALVALWPYTAVITAGMWTFVATVLILVVAVAGVVVRRLLSAVGAGVRAIVTPVVQLLAAAMAATAMLAGESAWWGVVPTPDTLRLLVPRLQQAFDEIATGVAPLAASFPLATLIGPAFALVAVLVDQLLAHRLVVLSVVLTSLVGVTPMLVSFGSVNVGWFLMQAVVTLLLLRFAARRDAGGAHASPVVAGAAGATAIAITLLAAPVLPISSALPGTGPQLSVSADLRLGDDLRRPESVEALTLVTSAATPPYLRLASLSRFDGETWVPDRSGRRPLSQGFGDRDWDGSIKTVEHQVSIRVVNMSSDRLPVPYAAESVTGVGGDWTAMPLNRTVVSPDADAAGSDYTVTTATAAPTLEQIRGTSAASGGRLAAPAENLPPIIADTARTVTAGADTDYDRLIALQDWFRSEFTYSLDSPVEDGFDGTGAQAVARFLEERSGYCIHFAGAFALMAQSMDVTVRIVVGYLPGTATTQRRGDDIVYSVSSDQLHSWPEVFFTGIGWVPFEPTATLGVPTDFVSAAAGGGGEDGAELPEPTSTPTTAPSDVPSGGPERPDEQAGGQDALQRLDPTPVGLITLGILALMLVPCASRALGRTLRMRRAARGDAPAAWRELTDTLIDLGIPAPGSETARTRAARLVREHGADAAALSRLVAAVEKASYAAETTDAGDLAAALHVVLGNVRNAVDLRRRLVARLLPISLARRAPRRTSAPVSA